MQKLLPIKSVIAKTFKLVFSKKYFHKFFIIGFILTISNYLFNVLFEFFLNTPSTVISPLLILIAILLTFFIYYYFLSFTSSFVFNFCLGISIEEEINFKIYLKKSQKNNFRVMGTFLLIGLIIFSGAVLFVFPAIIWGVKYFFSPMISAIEEKKPKEALKMSKDITKGYFWQILFRLVIFYLISSFPGLIISSINSNLNFLQVFFLPITTLFYVVLYTNLKYKFQNSNLS